MIQRPFSGEVVAENISAEEYMIRYASERCEWVEGIVIKMSPVSSDHYEIVLYLTMLFKAYFRFNPIGTVLGQPFVMRVDATKSRREPDLQVILDTNPGQLTKTEMIGPADVCIEIVSPESVARDYGDKFDEYEKGGVREYWIFDPIRKDYKFFRLNEEGVYTTQQVDANGNYRTPLLPHLIIHVPTLWNSEMPDIVSLLEAVRNMIEKK